MIAYKGFNKDLTCRGHKFSVSDVNVCEEANCVKNGFHCAENPLDVLTYYPNMEESVYWLVLAEGDINEDGADSKISCTELTLLQELTVEDFVWESLLYMAKHPGRAQNGIKETAKADALPFAIARGKAPRVQGKLGAVLGAAVESPGRAGIVKIAAAVVDGERLKPGAWYTAEELLCALN